MRFAAHVLLAGVAGLSWALVFVDSHLAEPFGLAFAVMTLIALTTASPRILRVVRLLACVSSVAGVGALCWDAAAWRLGVSFPKAALFVSQIYRADGEAAYDAITASLFLLFFGAGVICGFGFLALRRFWYGRERARPQNT